SLTQQSSSDTSSHHNQRYQYDAANRLSQVQDQDGNAIASYVYDPYGRRIGKTLYQLNGQALATPQTTSYLYNDQGLVAEADEQGNITKRYGWRPDAPWGTDPVFQSSRRTGADPASALETFYALNDHLGTTQKLIDQAGNVVWEGRATAFGETQVQPNNLVENNSRFPGQYFDLETQSHYNYFRDYDPSTGRYRERDPIGLEGGINTFSYVEGNPISYVDPSGEFAWGIAFAGVDLAWQLYQNGGRLNCVNWTDVGLSMLGGGLTNALFKGAFRFKTVGKNTWDATRKWMNKEGIQGLKSGQHRHHWLLERNQGIGKDIADAVKNQPWNTNPIAAEFNTWLAQHPNFSWLGAPSWVPEVLGGIATAATSAVVGGNNDCICSQ
ncbi:MAG TPA: RHS repeat-associated core domain-containing protein, partial [Rhodocyclaceae bacterium]